jgi:hypothetical protein
VDLHDRIIKVWDADLTRLLLLVVALAVTAGWIASSALDNVRGLDQPTATLVAGVTAAAGSVLIGVLALFFAWRNTRATLHQQLLLADRREVARVEGRVHLAVATWLGRHPVLREGEHFWSTPPFEPHLAVPSHKLLAEVRLFAADHVWELFAKMRELAYLENELSRNARLAMDSSRDNDLPFEATSNAQAAGWTSPAEAARMLRELREDWVAARSELETTLRRASRREG